MQTSDNLDYLISQGFSKTILTKFWRNVDKTDGCWLWTLKSHTGGYGQLRIAGKKSKQVYAHRLSWIIHNGPVPNRLFVLHRCDNPPCVRPDHLFLGTQRDNVADKTAKGRQAKKLKGVEVIQILKIGRSITQSELGHRFNVRQSAISNILLGKTWKHIPR